MVRWFMTDERCLCQSLVEQGSLKTQKDMEEGVVSVSLNASNVH